MVKVLDHTAIGRAFRLLLVDRHDIGRQAVVPGDAGARVEFRQIEGDRGGSRQAQLLVGIAPVLDQGDVRAGDGGCRADVHERDVSFATDGDHQPPSGCA